MRRIKLVLALSAVMVAMLVATAGPAMADHTNRHENRQERQENRQERWDDRGDRWDKRWHDNRDRNWDRDWWWDNGHFLVNDFGDDCEWEWEDEGGFWALGPWGWYWQPWGFWELDC